MKNLFLLSFVLFFSLHSFADEKEGWRASLGLIRYDTNYEGPNVGTGENGMLMYDLKLGKLSKNFYFGLIYDSKTYTSAGATDKRTAPGVSLGFHDNNWFADLNVFFMAERAMASTILKDGKGFGLDLGYMAVVNSGFFFGVQFSYKSITYEKVDTAAVQNKEKSEMYPMLIFGYAF